MKELQGVEPRKFEVYRVYNRKKDKKKPFIKNKIHTAKYNLITFFPKNIFFQFSKLSNLYFLIITLLDVFHYVFI
jgi:hypothetical protein